MFKLRQLIIVLIILLAYQTVTVAQFLDETGFTYLSSQFPNLEDGTTLQVIQVEAPVGNAYMPDPSGSQYAGKTLIDASGTNSGSSGHANTVSTRYFGNNGSLTPGISTITFFSADDYINNQTGFSDGGDPAPQLGPIQNHSWITNGLPTLLATNVLNRIDYMIDRDNSLAVVGANNGAASATPQIFGHGYNSLSVGRTDGNHSRTDTTFNGAGRQKPEIVAPGNATSFATPVVSGAAAILAEAAVGTPAENTEVIKALLYAGATKKEFPNWSRNSSRPIDDIYGFGEVNIFNSYRMFQSGEFDGSTAQPPSSAPLLGWDFGSIGQNETRFYTLVVTQPIDEISIALVWDLEVTDSNASPTVFVPAASLANLGLAFTDSSNGFPGPAIDFSVSEVDNQEHIYARDLQPGSYTIQVFSNVAQEYALAWRVAEFTDVAPESLDVVRGIQESGTIEDTMVSDDSYLNMNPGFTLNESESPVWLEFETVATSGHPNGLRFEMESNVSTPNLEQTVEFYNEATDEFDVVSVGTGSFNADSVISVDYDGGDLFRYLDSNQTMRTRVSWRGVGFLINFPWTVSIDRVGWQVSE